MEALAARLGIDAGRDRVARVMRLGGLQGATRTKRVRTTRPATLGQRPADLVERVFSAPAPNRLWVADLTYVWTARGFCYAAFIVDAFSKRWRCSPVGRASEASSTTRTGVRNTCPSATPSAWPRPTP